MAEKILKKKCKYCGKSITSMYPLQLDYNLQAHEISCKDNPKNKEVKNE